jgi:hypothetical protein
LRTARRIALIARRLKYFNGLRVSSEYRTGQAEGRQDRTPAPRRVWNKLPAAVTKAVLEGSVLAFINHSCRPSAVIVTQDRAVRAFTELKTGEEVTFFYPSTEWEMVRPFECSCGGPDCIGYVAGARYLSAAIFKRYFINPHIRQLKVQQYLLRRDRSIRPLH